MGLEVVVACAPVPPIAALLERLAAGGMTATVMMVDGALHHPAAPVPDGWRDLRLRTPAGTVTLRRHPGGAAVLVFGNADAALMAAQQAVAGALRDA